MSIAKSKTTGTSAQHTTKKSAVKLRAAKAVLPTVIKLSARDSKRLLTDLASPPKPNRRLRKAAARYKRLAARKQR